MERNSRMNLISIILTKIITTKKLTMKVSIAFFLVLIYGSVFGATNKDSIKAVVMYSDAKDLYYDGEYKKALKLFQRSLDKRQDFYLQSSYDITKVYLRMAKCERRLRIHKNALSYLEQGMELVQSAEKVNQEHLADYYIEFGATYNQMYFPEKASSFYKKAIPIYESIYGIDSPDVANIYMSIALDLTKKGHYKNAEKYLLYVFDIFKKKSKPESIDFNRIYNNLGLLYRKKGDYKKAIEYAENALRIKLLNYKETHPSVPKYYRNVGIIYYNMGDFEKALPFYKKTIDLEEQILGKDNPHLGGTYGELSNVYADLGRTKEAKRLNRKAIKLVEKVYASDHPYVLAGYYNEARLEEDVENYDAALSIYNNIYKRLSGRDENDIIRLSGASQRIGVVYHKIGRPDTAIVFFEDALRYLLPPSMQKKSFSIDSVYSKQAYLKVLKHKARSHFDIYKKDQNISSLEKAFTDADQSIDIIKIMRKSFQSEGSRKKLNESVRSIFDLGIEVSYELYEKTHNKLYLEKALQFTEDAKANILFQHIQGNLALASSGIDQSLLDSLQNLEDLIYSLEGENIGPLNSNKERKKRFAYKEQRENLLAFIEADNEKYYQLKYENKQIDLTSILHKNNEENKISINYYYTENYLFSFVFNNDKFHSFKVKLPDSFEDDILNINNSINNFNAGLDGHQVLLEQLQFYYSLLISPLENDLKNKDHILILPHGLLQLMPFDLLHAPTDEMDFRSLDYLIKQIPISYDWSLNFSQLEQNQASRNENLIGFAPSFDMDKEIMDTDVIRSNVSPLSFNRKEVNNILKHFQGESFLNNQATETSFIENVKTAKIIHLATHALIDNENPMESGLLFNTLQDSLNDGFLSSKEIYNLQLSADLATMSACNTAKGNWDKLEGIYSLARAFIYAGCKSVLSSLWLANDQSTSSIMDHFYGLLSKGMSKDVALQKAKIHYLENADQLRAHPFFWAGMVLSGDSNAISSNVKFSLWKNSWVMLLGLGLLFILLKRKNYTPSYKI